MNYGIGNVKGKGGGGKTYFYADFDDLTYDSSTARYTIDKSNVWCNFLSTLPTTNDFKVGDFLYACDFNVNGNGMVKLLLEIVSVGSTDLTLSACVDYAEQSSGIYYTIETLNAVGQTTQVDLSDIQINTNNSKNVLHENDLIIDANKKIGGVVSISNDVATIITFMELGGGGGSQLYQHSIFFKRANGTIAMLTIINNSNTAFTFSTLCNYLNNNGFVFGTTKYLMCTGTAKDNNSFKNIIGLQVYSTDVLRFIYSDDANQTNYVSSTYLDNITDTIITL